jgi:hypothetical protein
MAPFPGTSNQNRTSTSTSTPQAQASQRSQRKTTMNTHGTHDVLDTIESVLHHIVAPFHHKRHDKDLDFERKVYQKTTSSSYSTIPHDITCGQLHFVGALERCSYSRNFVDPNSELGMERERMGRRRARATPQTSGDGVAPHADQIGLSVGGALRGVSFYLGGMNLSPSAHSP